MKSEKKPYPPKRITTALLLAAGTGSRLLPLTKKSPKCLTLVNETSILERLIKSLNQNRFKRLVVVTGHMEDSIRNFLKTRAGNLTIEYVFSPLYKTTNNIYSLSVSSWHLVIEKLNQFIMANRVNDYYEKVFRQLVIEKSLSLEAVFFDHKPWYEIDTAEDLASAERLFPSKVHRPFDHLGTNYLKKANLPVRKKVLQGSLYAQS